MATRKTTPPRTTRHEKRRAMKQRRKKLPKGMTRLPSGSYRLRGRANGQPYDHTFKTQAEAQAELESIQTRKLSSQYVASAATTTYGEMLDALIADKVRTTGESNYLKYQSMAAAQKAAFGPRMLRDFETEKMRFVQEWFDTSVLSKNYLKSHRTLIKMAFDHAIVEGIQGRPSPAEYFPIKIRRRDHEDDDADGEDKVLLLEEMTAVLSATARGNSEEFLVARMRRVLVLLMLLCCVRPGAAGGLCWDCLDLDGRMFYVRRKVLSNGKLVWGTKTGKKGKAGLPMSPIVHAVLMDWRDRLAERGLPTTGAVPILRTERAAIITPKAISCKGHWFRIAHKARLVDPKTKALTHTAYCLRHTAANLLRAIGMDLEDLRAMMTHSTIKMTSDKYLHEAPHLAPLRREVENEVEKFKLARTRAGLVDALGIVLARRWREAGLDIPCSPPREMVPPQPRLPDYSQSNVVELRPTAVTVEGLPPPKQQSPQMTTFQEFRDWQMMRAREMNRQGATRNQIKAELGVDLTAIGNWLRAPEARHIQMSLPLAERKGIQKRVRADYESKRYKHIRELASAHGVLPGTVASWLRKGGWKIERERTEYKLAQHAALITATFAAKGNVRALARELGVDPSALWRFAKRHGLRDPAQEAADWAALKARVFTHLDDGKSYGWISRNEPVDITTVWRWNKQRKAASQNPADAANDFGMEMAG